MLKIRAIIHSCERDVSSVWDDLPPNAVEHNKDRPTDVIMLLSLSRLCLAAISRKRRQVDTTRGKDRRQVDAQRPPHRQPYLSSSRRPITTKILSIQFHAVHLLSLLLCCRAMLAVFSLQVCPDAAKPIGDFMVCLRDIRT